METMVIALGGNALIREHETGKYSQQMANVRKTCEQIAKLVRRGYGVVLTHGNGPQVGNLQIRMMAAAGAVPPMPLHVDVAMTQAQIGYMLQQSLGNFLPNAEVATFVTEVLVDSKDSAFRKPAKPIGPFYKSESEIRKAGVKKYVKAGGRGFRKIVASPMPKKIIQLDSIRKFTGKGRIAIVCGGGGIPVARKNGKLRGVEAVIDKDHCARLLGNSLGLKTLVILTDVEFVYLNYGRENQMRLRKASVSTLKKCLKKGHFSEGSMKPKVEAAVDFINKGGRKVIITSLNKLIPAVNGKTGTIITR